MSGPVLIVGAGIAGLTAALAFAQRGLSVQVVERAERLEAVGAGLQLSPNATRILQHLGLEERLRLASMRPEKVGLRDARSGRDLAAVRLGAWAEQRWGAPYCVLHRADLQRVLLEAAQAQSLISIKLGSPVERLEGGKEGWSVVAGGQSFAVSLIVGADGVNSAVRRHDGGAQSQASGFSAWRAAIPHTRLSGLCVPADEVTAFLHPRSHCVIYPFHDGAAFNLAAFSRTRGRTGSDEDHHAFARGLADAMPALASLAAERSIWSAWDVRTVSPPHWGQAPSLALIGDAAHAMTPFAAQGAASAIEDAATLAQAIGNQRGDAEGLTRWRSTRAARVRAIARRGRFNQLAWHAAGPIGWMRDLALRARAPEQLAGDLDWLYGWRMDPD